MIYLLKVFCDSRSTCMHISICYTNYRANRLPRLSPSQPNSEGEGKERNKEEREGPILSALDGYQNHAGKVLHVQTPTQNVKAPRDSEKSFTILFSPRLTLR